MEDNRQTLPPQVPQGTANEQQQENQAPDWLIEFIKAQQQTNLRLEQGIAALQTTNTAPNYRVADPPAVQTPQFVTSYGDDHKPRHSLPHPKEYTGTVESEFPRFRGLLEAKLRIDQRAIGSEEECIWYAYGRLDGIAASRLFPWMEYTKNSASFTVEEFFKQLDAGFADPQKQAKALSKINGIRQGNREFRDFLREFEQTLLEACGWQWDDQVRKGYLRAAINRELKDRLVTQEEPAQYQSYVNQLRRISDNLAEIKQWDANRNRNGRTKGSYGPVNNQPQRQATVQPTTSEAMDWEPSRQTAVAATGANRNGLQQVAPRSTHEQRQKWRDTGACARCGSKDHWVAECSYGPYKAINGPSQPPRNKPPTRKLRVAAAKAPKKDTALTAQVEEIEEWETEGLDSGKE